MWLDIGRSEQLEEEWLEWVAELAPIRVGFIPESLDYHPTEAALWAELQTRKQKVARRLSFVTHVVACDERDVDKINRQGRVPALWWPQAVPERFLRWQPTMPTEQYAVFCGSVYGERGMWLEHAELRQWLVRIPSPERWTFDPLVFDLLHLPAQPQLLRHLPGKRHWHAAYLSALRTVRQRCFTRWLNAMQGGCAVVNLPHLVKAYPGRVVEGMAAGRAVISWDLPDRPQNKALFEDGREILLYSTPSQLATHIKRLVTHPEVGQDIAANALHKIRRFHTVERRVREILDWIDTGKAPSYV